MRIGIIEDDRLLNHALEIALREAGYDTVSIHSKKEALALLDGREDLLLIDIGLPDGDGVRLYQEQPTGSNCHCRMYNTNLAAFEPRRSMSGRQATC